MYITFPLARVGLLAPPVSPPVARSAAIAAAQRAERSEASPRAGRGYGVRSATQRQAVGSAVRAGRLPCGRLARRPRGRVGSPAAGWRVGLGLPAARERGRFYGGRGDCARGHAASGRVSGCARFGHVPPRGRRGRGSGRARAGAAGRVGARGRRLFWAFVRYSGIGAVGRLFCL